MDTRLTLNALLAKEEIRELAQLYARGVDRKDVELLRTLYTSDATDSHGTHFDGSAKDYFAFLETSLPHMHVGGHFICNHLIAVDGDDAEGEVYAIAWHLIPDGTGGLLHDIAGVRYIDRYRREDGRWLFASRVASFDMRKKEPAAPQGPMPDPLQDPSYAELGLRLFARGPRA